MLWFLTLIYIPIHSNGHALACLLVYKNVLMLMSVHRRMRIVMQSLDYVFIWLCKSKDYVHVHVHVHVHVYVSN